MVKDHSEREEICYRHYMGCSFRLAAKVVLYALPHRQDSTYHDFCYTSRGALARTRNNSMSPPISMRVDRMQLLNKYFFVRPAPLKLTKEMLYLTTLSTRLYGVGHIVMDHSDSERANPLPPHGLLCSIISKILYMHHPTDMIAHTTAVNTFFKNIM